MEHAQEQDSNPATQNADPASGAVLTPSTPGTNDNAFSAYEPSGEQKDSAMNHSEQVNGSDAAPNGTPNGTPNVYRGSATPPTNTHLSNGAALEQQPVPGGSENSDDAQGSIPPDRANSVPQASLPPLSASRPATASKDQRPGSAIGGLKPLPQSSSQTRLPKDRIGQLEDRIAADPRGDTEAWAELIEEHKRRGKLPEARNAYDRFFQVFPSAAAFWDSYANMELDNNNFFDAEQVFQKALSDTIDLPSVAVWNTYLNYVRRRYNLNNDPDGKNRKVVSECFDIVLNKVGRDKDSGGLWMEWIQFLRSTPGNTAGTTWQDQQKKDTLRAAYHKAVCYPHGNIGAVWTDYSKFENGIDRAKTQAALMKVSPDYVQARSARKVLEDITAGLDPATVAKLPPALGFEGDVEYTRQVSIWRKWIEWEKSDPLILKTEQLDEWKARVIYVYKQALMPLRFYPEMWFEAAEFCLANGLDADGDKFLAQGTAAVPESCLLAFKRGERLEITTASEGNNEDSLKRRGEAVRKPYDDVINAFYRLIDQTERRRDREIAHLEEVHSQARQQSKSPSPPKGQREDEDDEADEAPKQPSGFPNAQLATQIEAIKRGHTVQVELLKKTLTFAWIALMRAMRRVQGQGKPQENEPVRGLRGVFADARKRGKLTSDIYSASALIEHHCFQDRVASKLFERGFKLFPTDVEFALAYIKHLFEIQDMTNARAVFKTVVGKLEKEPQGVPKTRSLYAFWHEYESRYGELNLVTQLEQHVSELFPEDPKLSLFSRRYSEPNFDPCAIRPVVSPAVQTRPKAHPSTEQASAPAAHNSPRAMPSAMAAVAPALTNSPKRVLEESDNESLPPRKVMRAESPLKGAAGRRLDAKRSQMRNELNMAGTPAVEPTPRASSAMPVSGPTLPASVYNFLNVLPPAHVAQAQLSYVPPPTAVLELLQHAELSRFSHERLMSALAQGANAMQPAAPTPAPAAPMMGWQPPGAAPPQYGYGQAPYMYR